jgi:DNA-binding PadR family transcriptional regulator
MTAQEALGGFQQLVLLAVLRLGDEAYGAEVQREIEETAGREVAISTIYVTLERLRKRGLVSSWLGEPTSVRGGKAKRFYRLTDEGMRSLHATRRQLERMWRGLQTDPRATSG